MFSLRLKCNPSQIDTISFDLWEAGTSGIRELAEGQDVVLIAGFETDDSRPGLIQHFAAYDALWSQEDSIDWIAATHRAWPGREVGSRIFLAPPWSPVDTPPGRLRVIHNPGLACGTGEHPCTQLALAALECSALPGKTVADIGAGSGLLAIAALHLGASLAICVDTDEAALSAARENFDLNSLQSFLVAGSAACLRGACTDVTVANISGTVLLSIAGELLRITAPDGRLILTGFTQDELIAIEQTFGSGEVTSSAEWRCLNVLPS